MANYLYNGVELPAVIWTNTDIPEGSKAYLPASDPVPTAAALRDSFKTGLALGLQEKPGRHRGEVTPEPPTLANEQDWYKGSLAIKEITSVTFSRKEAPEAWDEKWDASYTEDGSITGYLNGTDVYIVGNGATSLKTSKKFSFQSFAKMEAIHNLPLLDTSGMTSASYMFYACRALERLDLTSFDMSNCTNLYNTFTLCVKLSKLNVSGWNTGKVTNFADTFAFCYELVTLDLSSWDMRAATVWRLMFQDCTKLTAVYTARDKMLPKDGENAFWDCSISEFTQVDFPLTAPRNTAAVDLIQGWLLGRRLVETRRISSETASATSVLGRAVLGDMILGS